MIDSHHADNLTRATVDEFVYNRWIKLIKCFIHKNYPYSQAIGGRELPVSA